MTAPLSVADRIGRALFLRQQPVLRGLPAGALFALERSAREVSLAPGDRLDVGTQVQEALVAVVEGGLEAERPGRGTRAIEPGQLVGLTHLLASRPPLRLHAARSSRVLIVTDDELDELIERHFATVEVLVRHLARECLADVVDLPEGTHLGTRSGDPAGESLDFVNRLAIFAGSAALPSPSLDALAELARHAEARRWSAGETLWSAGDTADGFLLIVEGVVECDTGSSRHVHGGVGATIGEYEALAYDPRAFTALVARPLLGLHVDRDLFFDVLEDHAGMARAFLRVLALRRLELTSLRDAARPLA